MALPEAEALVIGSGAGGGIAAWVLAEAGFRVLVLEKGPWLDESAFSNDDIKFGYRDFYTQDVLIEPRTFRNDPNATALVNHASPLSRCVGGGTLHYGAASFRFIPDMFRMASLYGVPPGSTLVDWPLTYDELEPHYAAVEQAVGIAGIAPGFPAPTGYPGAAVQPPANALASRFGLHYSQPYPLPPVNQRYDGIAFAAACDSLGLHPYPTPCAINTVGGFQGRHACINCGWCNGWGCPNGSKSSTLTTVLRRAVATGRCEVRAECNVVRINVDGGGRATSVLYLDRDLAVQEQPAGIIVIACSAVETARLARLSGLDRHDDSGMIGHNLTNHHAPGAAVVITDGVHSWDNYRGAWNTTSIDDYQDLSAQPGLPGSIVFPRAGVVSMAGPSPGYPLGVGGPVSLAVGIMKPPGFYAGGGNTFSPYGGWGAGFLQTMAGGGGAGGPGAPGAMAFIDAVAEDLPQFGNMVDLDPTVTDVYGFPVARVTYQNHPNDIAVGQFFAGVLPAIGDAMLRSIGATGTTAPAPTPLTSNTVAPRYLVHQHGTMRMGGSAKTSVVNRCGQFWNIPNLFVADGSLFPTAGGYNPTHTIEALAHWVATCIVAGAATRPARTPAAVASAALPNTGTDGGAISTVVAAATLAAATAAGRSRTSGRCYGDAVAVPSVSIRRTVEADWVELRELRLRALADAPAAFGTTVSEARAQPESLWRDRARGTDTWRSFVAVAADELVGLAAMAVEPDGAGELVSMWVDPRFRGTPAATALVESAITWARVRGLSRVRLSVAEGNEAARRVYTRLGFTETGVTAPRRSDPKRIIREMAIDL